MPTRCSDAGNTKTTGPAVIERRVTVAISKYIRTRFPIHRLLPTELLLPPKPPTELGTHIHKTKRINPKLNPAYYILTPQLPGNTRPTNTPERTGAQQREESNNL